MLLWADGFDHYGVNSAFMLDGAYAELNACSIRSDNPRSGLHQLRQTADNDGGFRRVFGGDKTTVGIGYAFYIPALPTNSTSLALAEFRNNANLAQVGIAVTTTGQVFAYRSDGFNGIVHGTILATSAPCVVTRSYQHFECRVTCDNAAGAVEVRINGVTVLNITGVDTQGQATNVMAQVLCGSPGTIITGFPSYLEFDDLFAWDTSGVLNNDFIGDKKVYTQFPDADTAQADWAISTGASSWAMLAENPPVDLTDFLQADAAGKLTIVEVADIPTDVVSIAGVCTATRMWKTDAGTSKVVAGLLSGSGEADGTEHSLSQAATYYSDVFETDPATGAPWTVAGLNLAQFFIDRTV